MFNGMISVLFCVNQPVNQGNCIVFDVLVLKVYVLNITAGIVRLLTPTLLFSNVRQLNVSVMKCVY